jgi:hypothetical protein
MSLRTIILILDLRINPDTKQVVKPYQYDLKIIDKDTNQSVIISDLLVKDLEKEYDLLVQNFKKDNLENEILNS